jgi:hypothetical protein
VLATRYILDVRDKHKLTQRLIDLLPEADRITTNSALSAWWFNIRKNGGMRLTAIGYDVLTHKLDIEHYSYKINNPLIFNKRLILKLDRKMQMPYYIHAVKGIPKSVIFFGSREAVMVNLYGNLEQFLDSYRS